MTDSEDHRGSYALLLASEVSHARNGIVLASTDVDTKTNVITRFAALLDDLDDLRVVVATADVLHCTA